MSDASRPASAAPSAARALAAAATAMLPLLERAGVLRGAVPDRMLGDGALRPLCGRTGAVGLFCRNLTRRDLPSSAVPMQRW